MTSPTVLCSHLRVTQRPGFKRACSSFVGRLMAGQRNENGVEEHGRQVALPWLVDAQVPRAKPCCLSLVLPLYSPGSTMLKQYCCLPLVASCVKTTLCVGFREKHLLFQDTNLLERKFTSVHIISDYPTHSIVSSPCCFLGSVTQTSSTLLSLMRSWPQD